MTLAALLLAAAVGLLAARPPTARRLRRLLPRAEHGAKERAAVPRAALCALAGVALWLASGGTRGIAIGLAVALAGPRLLQRLDDTGDEDEEITARLPLALDLLGACLAGGGVLHDAVSSVAHAVPGPCGERLLRVAAALAVGSPPEEAFRALGDDRGPGGAAARALSRAAEGGTPVAAAVTRVAEESRRTAGVAARKRAKRAGVQAVGPLTACFLPAFVLLGVVPVAVGLAGPLLHSL